MSERGSHIGYRPDIDGLRTIAVLSVILFHVDKSLLPGGFLGVDIFFVISGFLISSNIFRELDAGTFSFREFYARRARRLLPALLFVITLCLAFGWFVLFSEEFRELGGESLAGTAFFSNFKFWADSGYFDKTAELKPLLHLWSLSLEEQFYFTLPLLLFALPALRRSVSFLALITAAVFACSVWLTFTYPTSAFYLPTRFWELLCGTALASLNLYRKELSIRQKNLLGPLGLILIGVGLIAIDGDNHFPGFKALVPVLGTICVIYARDHSPNLKFLASKPMVTIGLISYPLYLWHWPILYFNKIGASGNETLLSKVIAMAIATIFALLTNRFIEKGLWRHDKLKLLKFLAFWNVALIGVSSASHDHGNLQPFSKYMTLGAHLGEQTVKACPISKETRELAFWCYADKDSSPNAILLGDSHADAFYPGLVTNSSLDAWSFIGAAGCPPIYNVEHEIGPGWDAESSKKCAALMTRVADEIAGNRSIKKVLLVASSYMVNDELRYKSLANPSLTSDASLEQGFADMFKKLSSAGKIVYFLIDNPSVTADPQLCLPRPWKYADHSQSNCSISREEFLFKTKKYRELVQRIKDRSPGLLVFDPTDVFCNESVCPVLVDGKPLYSYSDHLSDFGNDRAAKAFISWEKAQR